MYSMSRDYQDDTGISWRVGSYDLNGKWIDAPTAAGFSKPIYDAGTASEHLMQLNKDIELREKEEEKRDKKEKRKMVFEGFQGLLALIFIIALIIIGIKFAFFVATYFIPFVVLMVILVLIFGK